MSKITNWQEADLTLKKIGELELKKEKLENELNMMISNLKLEYNSKISPLNDKLETHTEDLHTFVSNNCDDYDGKSKQLSFGRVGHRLSTKFKIPKEYKEDIIKRLEEKGMHDCIRLINKKEIDKSVLRRYSDNDIANIGIIKEEKNNFYYKINSQNINY